MRGDPVIALLQAAERYSHAYDREHRAFLDGSPEELAEARRDLEFARQILGYHARVVATAVNPPARV